MRNRFFFFRLLPAAALAAVLLAAGACGRRDDDDRTVIRFWCFWGEEVTDPLVEEFERLNPGIRVEVQQLTWNEGLMMIRTAMEAGRGPDLLELGSTWVQSFAAEGRIADLTDELEPLRPEMVMWEPCEYEGRTYAAPWMVGARAVFYNKDLFRRAGLDPGDPPPTWDRFLQAARAVHALGDNIYGYGMNRGEHLVQYKKFMPFAWSNGGDILTADGRRCALDSPQVRAAAEFHLRLARHSIQDTQTQIDDLFKRGRLGMMISGDWMIAKLGREAPDLEFGAALVPAPEGGRSVSFGGGEMLAIPADSQNKDAALKLMMFLIEPDRALETAQRIGFMMPARKGIEEHPAYRDNPMMQVFAQQLADSQSPSHPRWVKIEEALDAGLERMAYSGDPAELDRTCREIEEALKP